MNNHPTPFLPDLADALDDGVLSVVVPLVAGVGQVAN